MTPVIVDRELRFAHRAMRDALAYWQSRCGKRAMPSRADLDPLDMRSFLPYVGLVECEPSGGGLDFRVRLAGTAVEDIFSPISGRRPGEFLPPEIAARWRYALETTVKAAVPLRFVTRLALESKDFLTTEILIAPLSEDGRKVSMLFAVLVVWSNEAVPPEVAALVQSG